MATRPARIHIASPTMFGLIFRWHIAGLANAALASFRSRPGETLFIAVGAVCLAAYQLGNLYIDLTHEAMPIRLHWARILAIVTAMASLAGLTLATRFTRYAQSRAHAPWLAVLPWSDRSRRRAVRLAALWLVTPFAALIFVFVWVAAQATHAPHPGRSACAPFAAFAAACLATTTWHLRPAADTAAGRPPPARRPARLPYLLSWLDAPVPRWAGSWALGEAARYLPVWWLVSLLLAGGIAAAVSLAQHWPWPSLIMAILGGHIMFLASLRAAPLLSPVLRAAPVRYGAAWAAMLRLPLALSLAWLICATPPALAAQSAAWRAVPGVAMGVLLLNALFAAALATVPGSRRQALFLHALGLGLVIQQSLEYGLSYGICAAVLIFVLAIILVRQARRRFRANG
jgi:hypothetical protein